MQVSAMQSSAMQVWASGVESDAERAVELPAEPWVFGVVALVVLLLLLGVTFAFRHQATKL